MLPEFHELRVPQRQPPVKAEKLIHAHGIDDVLRLPFLPVPCLEGIGEPGMGSDLRDASAVKYPLLPACLLLIRSLCACGDHIMAFEDAPHQQIRINRPALKRILGNMAARNEVATMPGHEHAVFIDDVQLLERTHGNPVLHMRQTDPP
jgi:hypothetical protein